MCIHLGGRGLAGSWHCHLCCWSQGISSTCFSLLRVTYDRQVMFLFPLSTLTHEWNALSVSAVSKLSASPLSFSVGTRWPRGKMKRRQHPEGIHPKGEVWVRHLCDTSFLHNPHRNTGTHRGREHEGTIRVSGTMWPFKASVFHNWKSKENLTIN